MHPVIDPAQVLEPLPVESWQGPIPAPLQARALAALEAGRLLLLPLPFPFERDELRFLDPATCGAARKNISYDYRSGHLANATLDEDAAAGLARLIGRYSDQALSLAQALLPSYAGSLSRGLTSYRPQEIEGRPYSPRHDDRRLHVDAFPSRPMRGRRILRLFTNVAGDGALRHWRVGEPFPAFAGRFAATLGRPLPGSAWLQARLRITKGERSAYDHCMLQLHDGAKLSAEYQAQAPRAELRFAPGQTWMCFTDQVLHAALAGHAALEQTFYLPVETLADQASAPLRVLERLTGRALL